MYLVCAVRRSVNRGWWLLVVVRCCVLVCCLLLCVDGLGLLAVVGWLLFVGGCSLCMCVRVVVELCCVLCCMLMRWLLLACVVVCLLVCSFACLVVRVLFVCCCLLLPSAVGSSLFVVCGLQFVV